MLNFFKRFWNRLTGRVFLKKYIVTARRYTMPVTRRPVFSTFVIEATDRYQACRKFDTTLTAWTRLDVIEKRD